MTGFRMDAVPFIIERTEPGRPDAELDFDFLTELRQHLQWQRGDAVLLAEANVEPEQLKQYFGDAGGSANRLHMLFDFMLNGRVMLALARRDPESIIEALRDTPALPTNAQWATFLRNHDEVDLSRLTSDQRQDVFAQFGPDQNMRLYDRGIRRRLAPMLGGDQRRIELAYSLQFSLRGTPVLRYGEEIGMGEDLSLKGREAIRTPMQWSPAPNGGFSTAAPNQLVRPVVTGGDFGFEHVNVRLQRNDSGSLLAWFERMMRTLRECPEINAGSCNHVDVPTPPGVLAHRADDDTGTVLFLHNLGEQDATVDLRVLESVAEAPTEMLADRDYGDIDLGKLAVAGYGYRWIRLCRHLSPPAQRRNSGRTLAGDATHGRAHDHWLWIDRLEQLPCRARARHGRSRCSSDDLHHDRRWEVVRSGEGSAPDPWHSLLLGQGELATQSCGRLLQTDRHPSAAIRRLALPESRKASPVNPSLDRQRSPCSAVPSERPRHGPPDQARPSPP